MGYIIIRENGLEIGHGNGMRAIIFWGRSMHLTYLLLRQSKSSEMKLKALHDIGSLSQFHDPIHGLKMREDMMHAIRG